MMTKGSAAAGPFQFPGSWRGGRALNSYAPASPVGLRLVAAAKVHHVPVQITLHRTRRQARQWSSTKQTESRGINCQVQLRRFTMTLN